MTATSLPPKLADVLESCLYVDDLPAAERFYGEVLGLALHGKQEGRHAFFRCGRRMVLLFNAAQSSLPLTHGNLELPTHGATGPGHLCFGVRQRDLSAWSEQLRRQGVPIERVIDWPGGGRSLYFRDPAGNSLELATPRIWGLEEESLSPAE